MRRTHRKQRQQMVIRLMVSMIQRKKEFWIDRTDPDMNPLETLGHEFYHANDKMFGQFNELINSGINEAGKKTLSATEDDYAKAGMPGSRPY